MISAHQNLCYEFPDSDFKRLVNSGIESLSAASRGSGLLAIQAQIRLKKLQELTKEEREKMYRSAINALNEKNNGAKIEV